MPYDCNNSQHKLDGECPCTVPGTCDFTEKPFWELKTGEFFDGVVRIKAGDIFIKKLEPVLYDTIFKDIQAERARQNEKHPVTPIYFLHPENDPSIHDIKTALAEAQCDNDYLESGGEHSWSNIMREELLEVFSESGDTVESLTRMREEAIQGAALYVRLIETIDARIKVNEMETRKTVKEEPNADR